MLLRWILFCFLAWYRCKMKIIPQECLLGTCNWVVFEIARCGLRFNDFVREILRHSQCWYYIANAVRLRQRSWYKWLNRKLYGRWIRYSGKKHIYIGRSWKLTSRNSRDLLRFLGKSRLSVLRGHTCFHTRVYTGTAERCINKNTPQSRLEPCLRRDIDGQ